MRVDLIAMAARQLAGSSPLRYLSMSTALPPTAPEHRGHTWPR